MSAEMGVEGSSGRYFAFCSHVSGKRDTYIGGPEEVGVRRMVLNGCQWHEGRISIQGDRYLIRLLAPRFGSFHIMPSQDSLLVAEGSRSGYSYYFL